MKKIFSVAALITALISTNVIAEEATQHLLDISIGGRVVGSPCIVGNGVNTDINLIPISVDQIKKAALGEYLADKGASFNIHDCPKNQDVYLTFKAEPVQIYAFRRAIVNTLKPSGDVVAHYFLDTIERASLANMQEMPLNSDQLKQAQTPEGYDYPVYVGYMKSAEVQPGVSPAGKTQSVVTLTITSE